LFKVIVVKRLPLVEIGTFMVNRAFDGQPVKLIV
jgi:hypothetical protein